MSVVTRLSHFAQVNLVLGESTDERLHIKSSISRLKRLLSERIGNEIEDFVVFGSWTRNTILPRQYDSRSDVDILVLFKDGMKYSSSTYTNHLHHAIREDYAYSKVHRNFPTVQVEMRHLIFDLVPSYRTSYELFGNLYQWYYIPDKLQQWVTTTPNDINSLLTKRNKELGGNIMRQLIRLCKYWNASHGYQYESYLMEKEILNMHFWFCTTIYDYFISAMQILARGDTNSQKAIAYVEHYRKLNDELGQLRWLNHLLPGLA